MALAELITHALAVGGGIAASAFAYGRAKTRAEVDAKRGFPRVHPESEITRIGGGIHVETIVTTSAVGIAGEGAEVAVLLDDADEQHVEPTRRSRLRAAKEPVEDRRDPEGEKR